MKRINSRILPGLIFVVFLLPLIGYTATACTGIVLEGEDGTAVYGRTMEWGAFDWHAKAVVYPKGEEFQGTTPGGKNGLSWKGEYGFLGIELADRTAGDGMNEVGLAGGVFYHTGFAKYPEYDPTLSDSSMAPTDVLPYVLSSFSSISEVREGMKDVRVVSVVDPTLNKVAPLHLMIVEPSGDSLVIEFTEGEQKIYDNPVGVITNNPTFDWHLQNLRNYGYLSNDPFEKKTWGDLEITPLASGSGLLGLPGDYTAPSRFVRATVLKETSRKTEGGFDTVNQFFRIMDSFNVPANQGEGTVSNSDQNPAVPSDTQWTVAHDTNNLITYFHTMYNRRVRKIDLKELDFESGEANKVLLDEDKAQDVKEVTEELQ